MRNRGRYHSAAGAGAGSAGAERRSPMSPRVLSARRVPVALECSPERMKGVGEFGALLSREELVRIVAALHAMAEASVGVAMGGAGTDVALEVADIALMGDDLSRFPYAIALSRASRRMIVQNLVISVGVIALLVPSALLGLAGIGVAVVLLRPPRPSIGCCQMPGRADRFVSKSVSKPRTSVPRRAEAPQAPMTSHDVV